MVAKSAKKGQVWLKILLTIVCTSSILRALVWYLNIELFEKPFAVIDETANEDEQKRNEYMYTMGYLNNTNKLAVITAIQDYATLTELVRKHFCRQTITSIPLVIYNFRRSKEAKVKNRIYQQLRCDQGQVRVNITMILTEIIDIPESPKLTIINTHVTLYAYIDQLTNYFVHLTEEHNATYGNKWPEEAIAALKTHKPKNSGAVMIYSQQNQNPITVVHRTHLELFWTYYPTGYTSHYTDCELEIFRNLYSKYRLTILHEPKQLSQKTVACLKQTEKLPPAIRKVLNSWEKVHKSKATQLGEQVKENRVISMSLYGNSVSRYTCTAIRNAQLVHIVYPGWKLRFYVPGEGQPYMGLSKKVTRLLKSLGAELIAINVSKTSVGRNIPPMMWRFLVADDLAVDRFLVRDCDDLLSERDAAAVEEWIRQGHDKAFHCIRDHPNHSRYALNGGLVGGRNLDLRLLFQGQTWGNMMSKYTTNTYLEDMNFLNDVIWPVVKEADIHCSDSYSSAKWPNSYKFPVEREDREFVGNVRYLC